MGELAKVRKVLDTYDVRGVQVQLSKEPVGWTLALAFSDADYYGYERPQALHRDLWPDEEQYPEAVSPDNELEETAWDKEYDAQVGNFTTAAMDASVASASPNLSLVRTYNSLDPRRGEARRARPAAHPLGCLVGSPPGFFFCQSIVGGCFA